MKECSKSIVRRLHDPSFMRHYFVGRGLDIGGLPDPLSLYVELFPLMKDVRVWDLGDGDAQILDGVAEGEFDFVHSSHCLEHVVDPKSAMRRWMSVVRPGGFLILLVPDEDLYEQGVFPSTWNADHKWTFTVFKTESWSERSVNLIDLVREIGAEASLERVERLDATYRFDWPRYDQTLTPIGECAIEVVIRRRTPHELERGGRLPPRSQPGVPDRIHLNQYRDDVATLKSANRRHPPFTNDEEI